MCVLSLQYVVNLLILFIFQFSDGHYQASLIDALATSVSPIVSVMQPAG